jgi:phosphonatase-like hydrolase
MTSITTACLDMAGTTVSDDGSVMAAFTAAVGEFGLAPGEPGYDEAIEVVHATMGQSKIEVFRRILGDDERAQQANRVFEASYADAVRAGQVAPLPGAAETITALRAAGIRVCLATGFAAATRDALLDALGWWPLIDLALSPADAGRGRPWPDLPLTALIRLGGGSVSELAVVGDTPSDVTAGLRAGAGLVAGVLTGSASREELERAGAPHILDSVTGLLPLLGLGSGRPLHAHRDSDDNGSDDGEDNDSSGPAEAGQPG